MKVHWYLIATYGEPPPEAGRKARKVAAAAAALGRKLEFGVRLHPRRLPAASGSTRPTASAPSSSRDIR